MTKEYSESKEMDALDIEIKGGLHYWNTKSKEKNVEVANIAQEIDDLYCQLIDTEEKLNVQKRLGMRIKHLINILYTTRNGKDSVNVDENMEAYNYFADPRFSMYISEEDSNRLFLIEYLSHLSEEERCEASKEAKVTGSYISHIIEESKRENANIINNGSQYQKK